MSTFISLGLIIISILAIWCFCNVLAWASLIKDPRPEWVEWKFNWRIFFGPGLYTNWAYGYTKPKKNWMKYDN